MVPGLDCLIIPQTIKEQLKFFEDILYGVEAPAGYNCGLNGSQHLEDGRISRGKGRCNIMGGKNNELVETLNLVKKNVNYGLN